MEDSWTWFNTWKDGQMDGWMDEGCACKWMGGVTDGLMRLEDGWMDGWM